MVERCSSHIMKSAGMHVGWLEKMVYNAKPSRET